MYTTYILGFQIQIIEIFLGKIVLDTLFAVSRNANSYLVKYFLLLFLYGIQHVQLTKLAHS